MAIWGTDILSNWHKRNMDESCTLTFVGDVHYAKDSTVPWDYRRSSSLVQRFLSWALSFSGVCTNITLNPSNLLR